MERYEMLCDQLYMLDELLQQEDLPEAVREQYEFVLQEIINELIAIDKTIFFED